MHVCATCRVDIFVLYRSIALRSINVLLFAGRASRLLEKRLDDDTVSRITGFTDLH